MNTTINWSLALIVILSCKFLCIDATPQDQDTKAQPEFVIIDDPVLKLLDGLPAIDINNIRYFVMCMRQLQHGIKTEQGVTGLIKVDNQTYTLNDLVAIEASAEPDTAILATAMHETLQWFANLSEPYLLEMKYTKNYFAKLIDRWSTLRNKKSSYLRYWGKSEDITADDFAKAIKTFKQLDELTNDLMSFLADLIISCPKSFVASFKNPQQGKALLDKIYATIDRHL